MGLEMYKARAEKLEKRGRETELVDDTRNVPFGNPPEEVQLLSDFGKLMLGDPGEDVPAPDPGEAPSD